MNDPIITEIHKIKDAIARENGNDVRAILDYARRRFPVRPTKAAKRRGRKALSV
jgi:hypothetical protein